MQWPGPVVEAAERLHKAVSGVHVDDSSVPYFELVLGFIVVSYIFDTYLDVRQRKAVLTRDPPQELSDHYTKEHIDATRAYSVDKKNIALAKGFVDFLESFFTLWFVALPFVWNRCASLLEHFKPGLSKNEYAVSIAFMLATSLFEMVKDLPWSWYRTFVIEERHGFNKQTLALFFSDMLKQVALTALFLPPILSAVIYILKSASPYMPLYLWAFIVALQLVMMWAYPTLIAPLFNKYSPLEAGPLRTGIEELAKALQFPLTKLFVVDGSKRSGHSNAYMFGFGKNKRIVLYDTLIGQCDPPQVVAVLAHELGHWKLGHTICLMAAQQVTMLSQFVLFAVFRNSDTLLDAFGFHDSKPVVVSLTLFMMVLTPVDKLIAWLFNLLSRRYEFQADGFAAGMGHSTRLQEALKKLDKENKSDFVVDPLFSQVHYSHPPLSERLHALATNAKKAL